jgi:hypothetical protein
VLLLLGLICLVPKECCRAGKFFDFPASLSLYSLLVDDILSGLIFYASEAVRSHVVEAWQGLSILR